MKIPYQVVFSRRQTLGLQIREEQLTVRAPLGTSRAEIEKLIQEKEAWILSHLAKSQEKARAVSAIPKLTSAELHALADEALRYIPERVRHYAPLVGVLPRRITIRNQRTRWGSCSSGGNLNFNCLLMLAPRETLDAVVVHELCHMKEMNHSPRFYQYVYRVFPDYNRHHRWLKEHGAELLARLP